MRYVGYVRISSEEQRGNYSLAAQKHAIQSWVAKQQGQLAGELVHLYEDECRTGMTDDRSAFQHMLGDAREGKFDAIVVHKWDRLARLRRDAIRYKAHLRRDYGIKLFAAEGISEDEDEFVGMLFEAMTEVWSEFYSRNLARETQKGKQQKARDGKHNNRAPFGTDKTKEGILTANPKEQAGLLSAMQSYATLQQSDLNVAQTLNTAGYVTKQGKPFTADMVRRMLQNRTYIGEVRYQSYRQQPNGSRDKSVKTEWFKGQHDAIVPVELFERCQAVRRERQRLPRRRPDCLVYPLAGLLYCQQCGRRMRGQKSPTGKRYYLCLCHREANGCSQQMVPAEIIEQQVAQQIAIIEIPVDWRMHNAGLQPSYADGDKQIKELHQSIERLDFRWDMGFIAKADYLSQRTALQQQIAQAQPIAERELGEAEKVLRHSAANWAAGDDVARKCLLNLVLERTWVCGRVVSALQLRSPYAYLARRARNVEADTDGKIVVTFNAHRESNDANK